jgi:hypothetical protein
MRGLVIVAVMLSARVVAADPAPACKDDPNLDAKASSPRTHPPVELVGKMAADVIKRMGAPDCKSPERWRYWRPEGCAYEKEVVTLRFDRDGKVKSVVAVKYVTGEECI